MPNRRMITDVDLIAQIADLKEVDYKNTLILTALVELLVEKGILSRHDVLTRAQLLDTDLESQIQELTSTN